MSKSWIRFDHSPGAGLSAAASRAIATGTARALNKTATSERAALSSAIAKDIGLKVGTVRAAIAVEKASPGNLVARVTAKGKSIPLIEFSANGPVPSRGRGRGVSYRIGSQGRKRIPNAFIATMASGHRGVFVRRGKARLPISEKFGPSIAKVFERFKALGTARRTEVLEKNVQHEVSYALSKLR